MLYGRCVCCFKVVCVNLGVLFFFGFVCCVMGIVCGFFFCFGYL